jgi:predicted ABC-type ATPase
MASASAARRPALWIIAGPNGSGKSSAYGMAAVDEPAGSVWIINPDELAKRIRDEEGLDLTAANIAAVERMRVWLDASIDAYQTIGVETVLSTDKYKTLVRAARARGFQVSLIYVFLESADLNVERVGLRVRKGGHAVEEAKIRSRRDRSFEQFSWFFAEADTVDVFDNSGARPELVMTKRGGSILVLDDMIPELVEAIDRAEPGFARAYEGEDD